MRLFPGRLTFAALAVAAVPCGVALSAGGELVISQKNKQFQPGSVTLDEGQAFTVVNDDPGTVHHAYVESDGFNFDSGDQNPGSRTKIVFPTKGDFQVLCGIHPGMKLARSREVSRPQRIVVP